MLTDRINSISKAIEEEQFPLKWGHSNLINGVVDKSHLPRQDVIDGSDVVELLSHVDDLSMLEAFWSYMNPLLIVRRGDRTWHDVMEAGRGYRPLRILPNEESREFCSIVHLD